jgi:molybdopterin-binding protein
MVSDNKLQNPNLVSKSSIENMGLIAGEKAYVLIKSTEVTLAID